VGYSLQNQHFHENVLFGLTKFANLMFRYTVINEQYNITGISFVLRMIFALTQVANLMLQDIQKIFDKKLLFLNLGVMF
jgi:hypothetical protein